MDSLDPSFDMNFINVQHQDGYSDCSLFALAIAYDLCNGEDPCDYDQQQMKSHLCSCFEHGVITAFPTRIKEDTSQDGECFIL